MWRVEKGQWRAQSAHSVAKSTGGTFVPRSLLACPIEMRRTNEKSGFWLERLNGVTVRGLIAGFAGERCSGCLTPAIKHMGIIARVSMALVGDDIVTANKETRIEKRDDEKYGCSLGTRRHYT